MLLRSQYFWNLSKSLRNSASNSSGTCDFTSAGDVTYVEKALAPKRLQVNRALCKNDWLSTWAGANMRAGLDGTLQSDFASLDAFSEANMYYSDKEVSDYIKGSSMYENYQSTSSQDDY